MAQIFHRSFNVISIVSIWGSVFILAGLGWAAAVLVRSSYVTNVGLARTQPIQFSHAHHVRGLGIDCRYCHTSVEDSAFAGIPPTKTCMNCHSQIWTGSPILEPVRESYRGGKSIEWARVHRLADFAYFDHSIHVARGVGCSTCHGRVDEMQAIYQKGTLLMEWCLECHRQPANHVRPRDQVFNMAYEDDVPAAQRLQTGKELVETNHIRSLIECSTCHR
jgi:hypothetical protein